MVATTISIKRIPLGSSTNLNNIVKRSVKRRRLSQSAKTQLHLLKTTKRKQTAKRVIVDPEVARLSTVNPHLRSVPVDYVRDKLAAHGNELLDAAKKCFVSSFTQSSLPKEVKVVMNDMIHPAARPSHVLAVHGSSTRGNRKVSLFPVHSIVLATHCRKLPVLTASPTTSADAIPVVPLRMPSPASFGHLQTYLYTQDAELLRQMLWSVHSDEQKLLARGMWMNACVLGVNDAKLHTLLCSHMELPQLSS